MKRTAWGFLILNILLALTLSGCSSHQDIANETTEQLITENPIDEAFEADFDIAASTPELNYLAKNYLEAWQMEWDNITNALMKKYEVAEDQDVISAYRQKFEAYVASLFEVEWLSFTDTSVPIEERHLVGTGAISASTLAQAHAYKREVLLLIDRYYIENSYPYKYEGNGAQLLHFREEKKGG